MPELSQIFAKWKEAQAGIRRIQIPVTKGTTLDEIKRTCQPTILSSVEPFLNRELKSGERLIHVSHDMKELDGLGLLPTSKIKKEYVVFEFHRHGGIHELLLLDEDEHKKLRIIAIRFVYLVEATSGYATKEDELEFPLAPYDTDKPGMTYGRCRRSATVRFQNLAKGYENKSYFLVDGHSSNGFSRIVVHYHELLGEEALGSDEWSERTYGPGPDCFRQDLEWALEVCKSITQAGRMFEGNAISKVQFDQGQLMVIEMLESEDWLFSAFGSVTKSEQVELLQLLSITGPDTRLCELRRDPEKIVRFVQVTLMLVRMHLRQAERRDIMKVEPGGIHAAMKALLAYGKKGSCVVGKPKKGEAHLNRNTHFKLHIRIRSEFQRQRLLNQGLVVGPPFLTDLADSERIGVGQLAWSYRGPEGDLHLYKRIQPKGMWRTPKLSPKEKQRAASRFKNAVQQVGTLRAGAGKPVLSGNRQGHVGTQGRLGQPTMLALERSQRLQRQADGGGIHPLEADPVASTRQAPSPQATPLRHAPLDKALVSALLTSSPRSGPFGSILGVRDSRCTDPGEVQGHVRGDAVGVAVALDRCDSARWTPWQ